MIMNSGNETFQPRLTWTLWATLLAPPLAWLMSFLINYALASRICGTGREAILHLTALCALLVSVTALALARHAGRRTSQNETTLQFLATSAVVLGALSSLMILAQWLTIVLVDPCGF
jgi:hypothetical protein